MRNGVWQQSSNVLFGPSRNVLLTTPSLGDAKRTTTDDTSRERPADYVKEGEEEVDQSDRGCQGVKGQPAAPGAAGGATEGGGRQVGDPRVKGETFAPADRRKHGEGGGEDLVGGCVPGVRADVSLRVSAS